MWRLLWCLAVASGQRLRITGGSRTERRVLAPWRMCCKRRPNGRSEVQDEVLAARRGVLRPRVYRATV